MDDINRDRYNALFAEVDSLDLKITVLQHDVTEAAKAFADERTIVSPYQRISACNEIVLQRKTILSMRSEVRMLRDEARAISLNSGVSRWLFES
jgi:hypothetical protein